MNYSYLDLLVKFKEKKVEKAGQEFVQYLMEKYSASEPLYDLVIDWQPYFIKEDMEQLQEWLQTIDDTIKEDE
jgi:hypothetical protein